MYLMLKSLFNNVFTFKNIRAAWPYMLSVSVIRCKNEALKKKKNDCTTKSAKASKSEEEKRQVTGFTKLIFHLSRLLC